MIDNNIENQIKNFITERFIQDENLPVPDLETPLFENEILDSLAMLELIRFIEDHFPVKVEAEDVVLENFVSIRAIKSLVESKLQ
jgi:acyl carrier protein